MRSNYDFTVRSDRARYRIRRHGAWGWGWLKWVSKCREMRFSAVIISLKITSSKIKGEQTDFWFRDFCDFKWFQMISGDFRWFQVISNISEQTDFRSWNHSKSHEINKITWNHLKSLEITKITEITRNHQNHLKSPEIGEWHTSNSNDFKWFRMISGDFCDFKWFQVISSDFIDFIDF